MIRLFNKLIPHTKYSGLESGFEGLNGKAALDLYKISGVIDHLQAQDLYHDPSR